MSQPPNTRSPRSASGTTSLIFGDRPSVRFPRRTVPIWVSDPIGLARPRRMASTPAMNVVLTAPRPTSSTPRAARAGALVEVEIAPPTTLPVEADAFDVAVIDDTAGLLGTMDVETRARTVREIARILRPGGRVMVVAAMPRTGLSALFSGGGGS